MRSDFNNSNTLRKRSQSFRKSSIAWSMKSIKRLVSGTSFLRRSTRPSKKVSKPKMLRLISSLQLPESTHRHLVSLDQLWKRLRTLRVMPLERSRPPSRRSEKLTLTWSKLTKVNSASSVSPSRSLVSILSFQQIFEIDGSYLQISIHKL